MAMFLNLCFEVALPLFIFVIVGNSKRLEGGQLQKVFHKTISYKHSTTLIITNCSCTSSYFISKQAGNIYCRSLQYLVICSKAGCRLQIVKTFSH